ncbi:MAG: amidohydrolase family protein, partial [Ilumatobacteraceae bacterium]
MGESVGGDEQRTLLAGGMVFDGSGSPLFAGDVLISGNRIEAVLPRTDQLPMPSPADVTRIELAGRTVMPGLVEGHAHISFTNIGDLMQLVLMPVEENLIAAIANAALLLDHGFTSLVSAAASKPRLDVVVRNAIEAGQIVGPRMLAASQEITPTGNLGDLDLAHLPIPEASRFACICDGPEAFRLAARRFAREGVDILKVNVSGDRDWGYMGADATTTLIDDDELGALVKVAHGRGLRVAGHATSAGSVKMCVAHGVDIIYHAALADSAALDAIESVKDTVFVAPAVGFPYAYLHEGEKYGLRLEPQARRNLEEEIDSTARNMQELHRRGVRIVPGGDYGLACTPQGRNARDLELFVNLFGFTPAEALVAATNHGGAMMGRGDELGQLRAGWLADVIVVDGDPLDDIAVLQDRSRVHLVMKDGTIFRNDLPAA